MVQSKTCLKHDRQWQARAGYELNGLSSHSDLNSMVQSKTCLKHDRQWQARAGYGPAARNVSSFVVARSVCMRHCIRPYNVTVLGPIM